MRKFFTIALLAGFATLASAGDAPKRMPATPADRWAISGIRAEARSLQDGYADFEKKRQELEKLRVDLEHRRAAFESAWDSVAAPISSRVEAAGIPKGTGQVLWFDEPSAELPNGGFRFVDPPKAEAPPPPTGKP